MVFFYLISLLPTVIGGILWVLNKKIVLWEWVSATAAALALSGIFHFIATKGMIQDEEIWSGQITNERQYSKWLEYYEYAVYRTEYYTDYETQYYTDSKGRSKSKRVAVRKSRRVFDHWEPTTRWHNEYWVANSNINTSYRISHEHYLKLEKEFKHSDRIKGDRKTSEHNSKMIGGDPYDYISNNISGYIEPIVEVRKFENRIKSAPSVFSFVKVPDNIKVFDWPRPNSNWYSNRVLGGIAKEAISNRQWDELNAILGPKYKINLILIGFDSGNNSDLLQYQEAKFVGGRKNDLVISYIGPNSKPTLVKVFGWTESDICKANIESFIVQNGVNTNLLDFLKKEIPQNYKLKDWSKFNIIDIEPSVNYYYWFIGILFLIEGLLFYLFYINDLNKTKFSISDNLFDKGFKC